MSRLFNHYYFQNPEQYHFDQGYEQRRRDEIAEWYELCEMEKSLRSEPSNRFVSFDGEVIEDDFCDEDKFQPCSQCDGHDACADFGCAFELGLGDMVQKEPTADWD